MGGTIATSVNILSVPGNRSSPCSKSIASSTRFLLAELTDFIEISEPTFVFPVFLNITLLSNFIFISLILSITIFDRIVPFRVLDRYTTSPLSSCGVIFVGVFASLSSVAESINNLLNLPSHSSSLSRTSRISGAPPTLIWATFPRKVLWQCLLSFFSLVIPLRVSVRNF